MRQQRWALPVAALIVATTGLGLVAVAVHQDSSGKVLTGSVSTSTSTSTSTTEPSTTVPAAAPTTTDTSTSTTNAGVANTTSTTPPGATTATTRAGSTATTRAVAVGSGPAPTRPGTYTYTQSGGSPATLKVTLFSGGVESWVRSDSSSTLTTALLFNGSGVYTGALSVTALGTTINCSFASPVPWPPWPVAVGRDFSGQSTCSGSATLALTGHVRGTETLPLDGATVNTFLVDTTATITVGTTVITLTQTESYAPSLRLPVKILIATSLSSQATYVLATAAPAPA